MRVAALEVTLPAVFWTVTVKEAPLSVVVVMGVSGWKPAGGAVKAAPRRTIRR